MTETLENQPPVLRQPGNGAGNSEPIEILT